MFSRAQCVRMWLVWCLSFSLPAMELRAAELSTAGSSQVDFARDIQPIFQARCYSCHGAEKQKNGLRLDQKTPALQGGDSGPVIVPGQSSESKLLRLVAGLDPEKAMPPKGERLTPEQIGLLRAWIDQGADWPEAANAPETTAPTLWSLLPIKRPLLPQVTLHGWPRNAIDHYILAGLSEKQLSPSPEADRLTLLRRLTYDLHGLPPTPSEIDGFLADSGPEAYERLVDRLLAAPEYAERWGRHWLDVARYTESQGFEYDHMRENAWQYRDYVIASFNQDKPYDRFVKEQIAGDVLVPITPAGLVATSFLVCGPWDQAGSSQANVTQRLITREEELEDMISVVAQGFLGLTVNCARCHAHKFDPIPHADYYRMKSVFEGVRHGEHPIVPPDEVRAHEVKLARLKGRIATTTAELTQLERAARQRVFNARQEQPVAMTAPVPFGFGILWEDPRDTSGVLLRPRKVIVPLKLGRLPVSAEEISSAYSQPEQARRAQLAGALERDQAELAGVPALPVSYIGTRQQPEPTHRLKRGDVRSPMEVVRPGALSAVQQVEGDFKLPADAPEDQRRLRFAAWVADSRNPLTARVIVNRLWHYHFGQGIVATPNDFGASGAKPSHPELLDWLASELIQQHWSLKALHRLIVCSATYRQASTFRPAAAQLDAEDQLLWRFPPRRLEAEAVRDAILSVSGQLNLARGGPSFRPFDTKSFGATFYLPADKLGPEFVRRTVYRMNINSGKDPMLEAFDCPDPAVKTPRRGVTTTPLQALSLMNSSFLQRQSRQFAERVLAEQRGDQPKAIRLAYRYCFGREPSPRERAEAEAVAQAVGLQTVCWALLNATEFIYVQ